MSDIVSVEKHRAIHLRAIFQEILGMNLIAGNLDSTNYQTDGHAMLGRHCHFIIEARDEAGFEGAELPSFQAGIYHHEHTKGLRAAGDYVLPHSRLPCCQLIVFRTSFTIAGSAVTDRLHTDILMPILPLFCNKSSAGVRRKAVRCPGALRKGLERLNKYYEDTGTQPTPTADDTELCPYPTSFMSPTGTIENFVYNCSFHVDPGAEKKLLFCGKLRSDERALCIKFARKYSKTTHEFCAEHGWTPCLLGCKELPGGW
ncbi:hypothetical protein FRB95_008889 [Tulasnella sp. JGI-2019a]|nr:hypothetical protein FRB95_008889 [Tulasnella sp. JGI-2019a]